MKWTLKQIEELLETIYGANVNKWTTLQKLHAVRPLYRSLGNYFDGALDKGFSSIEYNKPRANLIKEIREHNYIFAGAKTVNYVYDTENLIVEGDRIIPKSEFLKKAKGVFEEYNKRWAEAEYETIIAKSQWADNYSRYVEDAHIFPNLRWETAEDETVCPICGAFNGIVKSVNDTFWGKYQPGSMHYKCHCHAIQEPADVKITDIRGLTLAEPPDGLKGNAGLTGMIFDKTHPYYVIPGPYKKYDKINFDFPVPNK